MRPFVVEAMDERVEPHLLLEHVVRSGPRRLGLEREVHALVAAVLFRMSRRNTLEPNAEPQPPHGEFA